MKIQTLREIDPEILAQIVVIQSELISNFFKDVEKASKQIKDLLE